MRRMGCKHARVKQPGAVRRLRAWLKLAQVNRDLAEVLEAVIGQQQIAIAAIYDDGFAEGRLAERLHPARGGPGVRYLHAVPSIRSGGHNLTGTSGGCPVVHGGEESGAARSTAHVLRSCRVSCKGEDGV